MRRLRLSHSALAAVPLLLYSAISIVFFGTSLKGSFSTRYIGYWTDPAECIWYLAWWPYAIAHHLNPFICKLVWAPGGVNLTWATSMPGAALLACPLTHFLGAVD